jgi:hypothetical protein
MYRVIASYIKNLLLKEKKRPVVGAGHQPKAGQKKTINKNYSDHITAGEILVIYLQEKWHFKE